MQVTRCKSCGAAIVWLKTVTGKSMPVDAHTAQAYETRFDMTKHVSHFATCKDANSWRKTTV